MKAFLHFGTGSEPRQTVEVEAKLSELPHHKLGLTWTASGYGPRIPSSYMVRWAGRWFRAPSYAHAVAHVRAEFPNATTQRVPAVMSVTSERVR